MTAPSVETMLRERIGLDPATLGASALPRAIANRTTTLGISDPAVYVHQLAYDAAEWTRLVSELLVAETWFFRGGRALFDHLANWVRTVAESTPRTRPVRIASIPCSTGEEPYSLAIAFEELGLPRGLYQIDGIDLSEVHLARARAAVYSAFSFREPSSGERSRWFRKQSENCWELSPSIRSAVHFECGNVVSHDILSARERYDLIVCRNVLIYMTPDARQLAFDNLERLLTPDGRLCLTSIEADRLPPGRFVADGPIAYAVFRKVQEGQSRSGIVTASLRVAPTSWPLAPPLPPVNSNRSRLLATDRPPDAGPLDPRTLADAGRIQEALTACDQMMKLQPASADLYSLLGVIQLAAGNRREAMDAFRRALYLVPGHAEALRHSILLHEHCGETDQATALRLRLARVEDRDSA